MALQVEGGCPGSQGSPGQGRADGWSSMSQAQWGPRTVEILPLRSAARTHISGVWAAPSLMSEGGGSASASVLETVHLGHLILPASHSPIS